MTNFYPGPSKIHPECASILYKAIKDKVAEYNHRSPEFKELYKNTSYSLKEYLRANENDHVFFTSSATEMWEIALQSLKVEGNQFHMIYNGSFGEKWGDYALNLYSNTKTYPFEINEEFDISKLEIKGDKDIICLVHNETSNGTKWSTTQLKKLRNLYPNNIIVADATSSLGGTFIPLEYLDFTFASVQKCFGMPSGMAIGVASSTLYKYVHTSSDSHYNSLQSIFRNADNYETTHTPNILYIHLLNELLSGFPLLETQSKALEARATKIYKIIEETSELNPLITNALCQSDTVLVFQSLPEKTEKLKITLRNKNIIVGNGYGRWKSNTIRIANFPAITDSEVNYLIEAFGLIF